MHDHSKLSCAGHALKYFITIVPTYMCKFRY